MRSPFYQADIQTLFPHRKYTPNIEDVVAHAKDLIAKGIDTREGIGSIKLGTLQRKYFVGASVNGILEALRLID